MSKPAYHIRTYFSCSRGMYRDLKRMSFQTQLSISEIVRIAINELIKKWEEKRDELKTTNIDGS